MLSKLFTLPEVLKQGKVVANPEAWKNGQINTAYLVGFLGLLVASLSFFGVNLAIDESTLNTIAGAILALYGIYNQIVTMASSEKVGIKPTPPKPTAKPTVKSKEKPPTSPTRVAIASLVIGSAMTVGAITQFEGFRSKAYVDLAGIPTIGYGTTEGVKMGDTITKEEAEQRLIREIGSKFHPAIASCVKVPLYQHEYDAYTSLVYNIGGANFCKSTLVKVLNQSQYTEACNQIIRWNRVKGEVVQGLVNRREEERKMCLGELNK